MNLSVIPSAARDLLVSVMSFDSRSLTAFGMTMVRDGA